MNATTNPTAVRHYEAATISLANAEELLALFENNPVDEAANPYICAAHGRALELVVEMQNNLDDVMDRWSPAECGMGD